MTLQTQMVKFENDLYNFMHNFTFKNGLDMNDIPREDWNRLIDNTLLPYRTLISTQTFPNQKRVNEVKKEIRKIIAWANQDPRMLKKLAKNGSGYASTFKESTITKVMVAIRRLNDPTYDLAKAELSQEINSTNQAIREEVKKICRSNQNTTGTSNSSIERNIEDRLFITASATLDNEYSKYQSASEDKNEIVSLTGLSTFLKGKLRNIKQSGDILTI